MYGCHRGAQFGIASRPGPGLYRAYVGERADFPGHCYIDEPQLTWTEARDLLIGHLESEVIDCDRRPPGLTEPWMIYAGKTPSLPWRFWPGHCQALWWTWRWEQQLPDRAGCGAPGTASTPPELAASIAAANPSLPGYRASDAALHAANPLRITATRMLMAAGPRRTAPDLRPQ
jgi:hypothetical protein